MTVMRPQIDQGTPLGKPRGCRRQTAIPRNPSTRSSRRRPQHWSLPHDIDVDTVAHRTPRLRTKLLINSGPSDGMPIASFVSSDDRLNQSLTITIDDDFR